MNITEMVANEPLRTPLGSIEVVGYRRDEGGIVVAQVRVGDLFEDLPLQAVVARISHVASQSEDIALGSQQELLRSLSEEQRDWLLQRERHVLDVRDGRPEHPGVDRRYVETVPRRTRAQNKCAELGKSVSQINRWIQAYGPGNDRAALLHGNIATAQNVLDALSGPVVAILRDFVRREQTASAKTAVNEHAMVLHELRQRGVARSEEHSEDADGSPLPEAWDLLNEKTFKKAIRALRNNAPSTQDAKTRQSQARRPLGYGVKHHGYTFGDVVMVDATKVDIEVQGPHGPFRPHALFAICCDSRYVWLRLIPHAPTGKDLGLLFHDMLNPQPFGQPANVYQPIPMVPHRMKVNAWPPDLGDCPPAVVPGIVIADHGAEEENKHHLSLLAQLGIQVEWARAVDPTTKGEIESSIRTYARGCQVMPGHVGNAVKNSPSADGRGSRLLSFRTLAAVLQGWPYWYSAQPHTGLKHPLYPDRYLTPSESVHLALSYGQPLRVAPNPYIGLQFFPRLNLTPTVSGVEHKNVVYCTESPEEYKLLLKASFGTGPESRARKLTFHHDPYDPRRLFWPIPNSIEWMALYGPGGNGAVSRPFSDYVDEALATFAGHSAPTTKSKTLAAADWVGWVDDLRVDDGNPARAIGPRRSGRTRASVDEQDFATALGIDYSAFGAVPDLTEADLDALPEEWS